MIEVTFIDERKFSFTLPQESVLSDHDRSDFVRVTLSLYATEELIDSLEKAMREAGI